MGSKRIWAGLATSAIAGLVLGETFALANVAIGPVVEAVAIAFVVTAAGAFVARRGFIVPALGLWLLNWTLGVCAVYWVAQPTGQASLSGILRYNSLGISLSALAVLAGALFGAALAQRLGRTSAAD